MSHSDIYLLINASVMPAWALLIFAPRWSWTGKVVHAAWYPLGFGVFYSYWLLTSLFFGAGAEGASFLTLDGVMALFSTSTGILVGWSHYLVFDLFVGAWISRDSLRRGVNTLLVAPCLFFTLMFGPIGLMLYMCLRLATGKGGFSLNET